MNKLINKQNFCNICKIFAIATFLQQLILSRFSNTYQGEFFKLRGLEIPNIEQKVFGACQTTIQKPLKPREEQYQFAYEKDSGTIAGLNNMINFIQKAQENKSMIDILILDSEGGFNRIDQIHAIQQIRRILKRNSNNKDIINTISYAQIEEMSHPIGISRLNPQQNRIYQINGIPQGSATSPEVYCLSIHEGIEQYKIKFEQIHQDKKILINAYMDDLIIIIQRNKQFINEEQRIEFYTEQLKNIQQEIKQFNPSYEERILLSLLLIQNQLLQFRGLK